MTTIQIVAILFFLILNLGSIIALSYKLRNEDNILLMVAMITSIFIFTALISSVIILNKETKSKGCPEYEQVIVPRLQKIIETKDTLYKLKK